MITINKRKRRKQWEKAYEEGVREYEKNSDQEYDYYGKVERYKNVKFKKGINYAKIIRYILGISLLIYNILRFIGKI